MLLDDEDAGEGKESAKALVASPYWLDWLDWLDWLIAGLEAVILCVRQELIVR